MNIKIYFNRNIKPSWPNHLHTSQPQTSLFHQGGPKLNVDVIVTTSLLYSRSRTVQAACGKMCSNPACGLYSVQQSEKAPVNQYILHVQMKTRVVDFQVTIYCGRTRAVLHGEKYNLSRSPEVMDMKIQAILGLWCARFMFVYYSRVTHIFALA